MSSAPTLVPVSVLELARMIARAIDVFGSSERATAWLATTNPALGGRVPLQVFQTSGTDKVEELLTAIEHGTVS